MNVSLTRKQQWKRVSYPRERSAKVMREIENISRDISFKKLATTTTISNYYINRLYSISNNRILPKRVTFDSCIRVMLIPTRYEYKQVGLIEILWWTIADYSGFRRRSVNANDEEQDQIIEMEDEYVVNDNTQEITIYEENRRLEIECSTCPDEKISDEIKTMREKNYLHAEKTRQRKKLLKNAVKELTSKLSNGPSLTLPYPHKCFSSIQVKAFCNPIRKLRKSSHVVSTLDSPSPSPSSHTAFSLTNPALPGNPITFASQGLMHLIGPELDQVIGTSFTLLHSPGSDNRHLDSLRRGISSGIDMSAVLLTYRADGTASYTHVFVAPLRDKHRIIVNFVGVLTELQCERDYKCDHRYQLTMMSMFRSIPVLV